MLWILPNVLSTEQDLDQFFVPKMFDIVPTLDGIIAESDKAARQFLKRFNHPKPPHTIPVTLWNEHSSEKDINFTLEPIIKNKQTYALISDAGIPCVADPGHQLILHARNKGVPIQIVSGPSSLFLALQLSGLPGQRFSFDGYLPRDEEKRKMVIKKLSNQSLNDQSTIMVMDAPYRNLASFEALLKFLDDSTLLCVAREVALPGEWIETRSVADWKKEETPDLHKKPTLFLFHQKEGRFESSPDRFAKKGSKVRGKDSGKWSKKANSRFRS